MHARSLHERQDRSAVTVYRQANHLLHTTLFPAADALTKANRDRLSQTYADVQSASGHALVLLLCIGVLLPAALIGTQILSQKTRRLFNPTLLIATLLAAWLLVHTWQAFRAETVPNAF